MKGRIDLRTIWTAELTLALCVCFSWRNSGRFDRTAFFVVFSDAFVRQESDLDGMTAFMTPGMCCTITMYHLGRLISNFHVLFCITLSQEHEDLSHHPPHAASQNDSICEDLPFRDGSSDAGDIYHVHFEGTELHIFAPIRMTCHAMSCTVDKV